MASLLHVTPPFPHIHSVPSSINDPSTTSAFVTRDLYIPRRNDARQSSTLLHRKYYNFNKGLVCQSSSGEVTFIEPPETKNSKDELIGSLKLKLLGAVSGLNRGLPASEDDLLKADAAAKELEYAGGSVDLSADIDKLQGRWKLIYSSAFSSKTLGGSRPGPPTGRLLPLTLGQVFQRIDVFSKDFDNIVELEMGAPWPLPPIEVTASLAHKFDVIGTSKIKITFEKTTVKTRGNSFQNQNNF